MNPKVGRYILSISLALLALPFAGCGSGKSNDADDGEGSSRTNQGSAVENINEQSFPHPLDRTVSSGVSVSYESGRDANLFTMLETLGGGVSIADFDLDNRIDLVFPGGGHFSAGDKIAGIRSTLWMHRADQTFVECSSSAQLDTSELYSHGAYSVDYNNDGFQDLLFTGFGAVQLFTNMGDGTFHQEPSSTIAANRWSTGAAWGDWDNDGDLDLYIANYLTWDLENNLECFASNGMDRDVCSPHKFDPQDDQLFINDGSGQFIERSSESGLVKGGKGLGVVACDFDQDGDTDIYVANDVTPNRLYVNDGSGVFEEQGLVLGVAVDEFSRANGSMGIAVGDYDNDQNLDIGVSNFEHESYAIYRQESSGIFANASNRTGMTAIGDGKVGWGTCFLDWDADGDEDLLTVHGHIVYHPRSGNVAQEAYLLSNRNGVFKRVSFNDDAYLGKPHYGRGLVWGDLNRDGFIDLVFSNVREPAAILSNTDSSTKGFGRHLFVRLIGEGCNRDAVGARLTLTTEKGEQIRSVFSSGGYLSGSQSGVCFGIAKGDQIQSLVVTWPQGVTQTVEVSQEHHIVVVQETRQD